MGSEKEKKVLLAGADSDTSFVDAEETLLDAPAEEEPGSSLLRFHLPEIHWKTLFLIVGITIGLVFHWFSTSELFTVPQDVATSRENFFTAKENYFQNSAYWDAKQKHFVEKLQEIMSTNADFAVLKEIKQTPGEIFISYMLKNLHINPERLEKSAVFTKDDSSGCSIIISKPEKTIWPLRIMLSLEIEVKIQRERFSLTVSRLRKGSQDIALGLAWTYFGPELESIRQVASTSKQSFILLTTNDT